jgi:hypothetical protein
MDIQSAFGFQELLTHVVGDMARAVCERPGETRREHHARSEAAAHMIMGFFPRDVIEAILAGRCVMFHEMMTDSVRDTMRGEVDSTRRATRGTIVAMDKAFGANLTRLEHYRARPAEGNRDMPEETAAPMSPEAASSFSAAETRTVGVPAPAETPAFAAEIRTELPSAEAGPLTQADAVHGAIPGAIDAGWLNAEAMAAMAAGDAAGFARAMGVAEPSEAFLAAAAAPGSPFDLQAKGPWPVAPGTTDV